MINGWGLRASAPAEENQQLNGSRVHSSVQNTVRADKARVRGESCMSTRTSEQKLRGWGSRPKAIQPAANVARTLAEGIQNVFIFPAICVYDARACR